MSTLLSLSIPQLLVLIAKVAALGAIDAAAIIIIVRLIALRRRADRLARLKGIR